MTSETRTIIEPCDFNAIEFECRTCHHRFVRPMGAWKTFLFGCPNCETSWGQFRDDIRYLSDMATRLPKLMPAEGEGHIPPFIVRCEIAQPKPKDQQ